MTLFVFLTGPCNSMVSFNGLPSGCFYCADSETLHLLGAVLHQMHPPSKSLITGFTFPSNNSFANLFASSSIFLGLLLNFGILVWIVVASSISASTSWFSIVQDALLSMCIFTSADLNLDGVLCITSDGMTIIAFKQISLLGDFDDHSFISFVSSVINDFPRFLWEGQKSFFSRKPFVRTRRLSQNDISLHRFFESFCHSSFQSMHLRQSLFFAMQCILVTILCFGWQYVIFITFSLVIFQTSNAFQYTFAVLACFI